MLRLVESGAVWGLRNQRRGSKPARSAFGNQRMKGNRDEFRPA
jgi:hypothetical protein